MQYETHEEIAEKLLSVLEGTDSIKAASILMSTLFVYLEQMPSQIKIATATVIAARIANIIDREHLS